VKTGVWEPDLHIPERPRLSALRRAGLAVATFVLGGLTTMEVIAVAIASLAFIGFLWGSGTVAPERLITGPAFRAAWILLVLVLVRPLTWIPYLLPFVALRKLFEALRPGGRAIRRNAMAHALTVVVLVGIMWLVLSAVDGAGTRILSGLAFATGSGSFATLGSFRGDWTDGRVALIVAAVILGRLVLPPLGLDLDVSREPVLGFADGARGTFDRYLLLVVAVASLGVGLVAYLMGRS
jgi:hypothetical protein